jgi:murein L,D-transpeptidase YcbB/YkuD
MKLFLAALLLCWAFCDVVIAKAASGSDTQGEIRARALTERDSPVYRIYEANQFSALWYGSQQADSRRADLLQSLAQREGHGLPPDSLCALAPQVTPGTAIAVATADLALTHCLLRLHHDVSSGMASKTDLGKDWVLPADSVEITTQDLSDIAAGHIGAVLSRAAPQANQYRDLQRSLLAYLSLENHGGWQPIEGSQKVAMDGTDSRLSLAIARLRAEGYLPRNGDVVPAAISEAVRDYQARNGLKVDGTIGKSTIAAMNIPVTQRVAQIAVNLERWRHTPRSLEPAHVEVNIADASLVIFQPDLPPARLKTIIGDDKHPTPIFRTRITAVTFNPSWAIPASIASREILPKLRRNPRYLLENEIVIVNGESDPYGVDVDWQKVSSGRFHFQLRQSPGPKNSLGLVKFEMANPFDVYIHDTPSRSLFALPQRGLSHGCIRVEDPLSLAARLLPNLTPEEIQDKIGNGATETLSLARPLPVYVFYWTAFVDAEGNLNFRNDIYGRDGAIAKALHLMAPKSNTAHLVIDNTCLPST